MMGDNLYRKTNYENSRIISIWRNAFIYSRRCICCYIDFFMYFKENYCTLYRILT